MVYRSDIHLGEEYEDTKTGLVGRATAIYFFEYACERVCIEYLHEGAIKTETFDAPRLVHRETRRKTKSKRPGGPARERDVRARTP